MISKAKMNYWVDVVIGLGFILSAISGLVLFFAPSGGYQGGRNAAYGKEVLGLGHHTWGILHDWSSIVMIAGVLGHLILHWNWMVCMTRHLFKKRRTASMEAEICSTPSA